MTESESPQQVTKTNPVEKLLDATAVILLKHRALSALTAFSAVWGATFFRLAANRHDKFGTFGFDLGIFDQITWLIANNKGQFVTVRGLEIFGHHGSFVYYLFAPFYWLGGGPKFLLFAQLMGQISGAIGIYLLTRDRLRQIHPDTDPRWIGAVLGIVFLVHPTMQWFVWEFFHPEVFAVGPLILAYWAARTQRWPWFWAMAVLAISAKEDAAPPFIILGILLFFWGHKKKGIIVAGGALSWYVFVTKVLIPWRNPYGTFYERVFFGDYGSGALGVIWHFVVHPGEFFRLARSGEQLSWYLRVLGPLAFVPLLAPDALAMALPMIGVIIISVQNFVRNPALHYSALPLAVMMIASVEVMARLRSVSNQKALAGLMLGTAITSSAFLGISPLSKEYESGVWPSVPDPTVSAKQKAVKTVPKDASVSAMFNIVPHLTHREIVYEFPNPWIMNNFGTCEDNPQDPGEVDWIVLDRSLIDGKAENDLVDRLLSREFRIRYRGDDVLTAQRVSASKEVTPPGKDSCE